ncbi:tetratricopeptide repeat protein 23 isoform X2 [Betta splendens]|uniref:Tetratricopeptide repeat protein 23 isoform X2 n=1 Tax=Betta splendens TaxID=158456 RepID=A0A6P7MPF6_BETSP|nr:tetratricopeptide repeat protein 23 isoform X2 [Betta splendens]
MDGAQPGTKTRSRSFDSPTEGGGADLGSDALRASATHCAKKEPAIIPPEEKLKHFEEQARMHEGSGEDLVHCVALTRLVHGKEHLEVAQAHGRLAEAYLRLKGWGPQAQEHSARAREALPFCPVASCSAHTLQLLLHTHLTAGGAALLTHTLEEAQSSFLEAEQILGALRRRGGVSEEEEVKTQLRISAGLCRVYRGQNRPDKALNQCEKSLQLLRDCEKPEETCSVYRDMAAIEQGKGQLDRAMEHLSKAHAIAMSHIPEQLEGARVSHSLALVVSAAAERSASAAQYFEQSLAAYEASVGRQDPAFLAAQDDFCHFLLLSGQQERCVGIQQASLASKRSTFGDLSAEVADTLQLIASVEMSEGRMRQAYKTMAECLEVQSLLYGPQHKKTQATQQAVEMLARAPEVAEAPQKQSRRTTWQ